MSGANGMRVGDRVRYAIDGRCGIAEEFLQDGDAVVTWDDDTRETVKWNHLAPVGSPRRGTVMKLDAKHYGNVYEVKDDSLLSEAEWVLFLIKDNAFFATLPEYRRQCVLHGAGEAQLRAVDRMIARGAAWRADNYGLLKTPDVESRVMLCTDGPPDSRRRQWFLRFDDPDRGFAVFRDEEEAMRAWDRAKDHWTCTLFVTAEFVQPSRRGSSQ